MDNELQTTVLDGFTYFTPYSVDIFNFDNHADIKNYMEKFRFVSGNTRDIIFNPATADFIQEELVPSFNLNLDQGKEITRIIRDVLLTEIFIGDMTGEISKRLKIDQGLATQVGSKVVSELFAPAIEEIKEAHSGKFANRLGSMRGRTPAQTPPQDTPKKTIFNPAASLNLGVNDKNVLNLRK